MIVSYTHLDVYKRQAEYPTSLKELAYSIKFLREHAKEWHIDPHKIVVEGCSAGGHLAASLGVFWDCLLYTSRCV